MKVLVTGAAGFLGTKIMQTLKNDLELVGTDRQGKEGYQIMDITDRNEVISVIGKEKPDAVIHCAAMTDVDASETEKEKARKINVEGASNVVDACEQYGSTIVYISTDFIFEGDRGGYKEEDEPNPLSYYAKTKLEAENIVRQRSSDYLIIRPEVLYGYNGNRSERSFTIWVYDNLKKGNHINVVDDQYNTPTLIDDIAEAISKLLKKDSKGIYHVAGPERLSRYEMAVKLAEVFGFDKNLIKPITSDKLKQKAKRPKDSSLDTEKLKKEGINMHTFEQGLRIMKGQMSK
ncbi:dTDP-4-dehydrorhamnose reductase [Candidatus Woesearchaeota archaeon]|nr:dTDP-4-dehydrorhamnose reductase [Candidatus Woesearchaeota archaeon]